MSRFAVFVALFGMIAYSQAGVVPAALPYTAPVAAPVAYAASPLAYSAPFAYSAPVAAPVAYNAPLAYNAYNAPLAYNAPVVAKAVAPVAYSAPLVARAAPVVAAAPAPVFAARAAPVVAAAAPAVVAARAAPVVAAAAPAVVAARAAPVAAAVVADTEFDINPQYTYAYSVNDGVTGDSKAQEETRDGGVVRGSYSLIEPDGARRTVQYYADPINGFNAVVQRDVPVAAPIVAAPAKVVAV